LTFSSTDTNDNKLNIERIGDKYNFF